MNKKILFLTGILFMSLFSYAQKSKVREANKEINNFNDAKAKVNVSGQKDALTKAKAAIDEAVKDPSTSEDAKTWISKAIIYMNMQEVESLNSENPYLEAQKSLKKAMELDPKLNNDDDVVRLSYQGALYSFNDGVNFYNESKFEKSYESFANAISYLGEEKSKRFNKYPVDTIRAQAQMLQAYDAYYLERTDEAIQLLTKVAKNPFLANQSGIYLLLAQAYQKKGDQKNELKSLEDGLAKYPTDQNLKNAKLNFLMASGNYKELEDASNADPNNIELLFSLGIIYQGLGMPESGIETKESKLYLNKAEELYKRVLSSDEENGVYNYQLGAFFFNQAAQKSSVMNDLPISEKVKYEQTKNERDALLEKALPLLEKSRSIFGKSRNLNSEEKNFQLQALQALAKIYASQNKLGKVDEMNKEIEKL